MFLICTTAPLTGTSSGVVTVPWTLRLFFSAFLLWAKPAGAPDAHISAIAATASSSLHIRRSHP